MKPRPKAPLLITRCDLCCRRRTCAPPIVGRQWLCRQCIHRVEGSCFLARLDLAKQDR